MTPASLARIREILADMWGRQELLGARNRELVAEALALARAEPAVIRIDIPPARSRWVGWWHIHYVHVAVVGGIHQYEECRCGARRTQLLAVNLLGPSWPHWPAIATLAGHRQQQPELLVLRLAPRTRRRLAATATEPRTTEWIWTGEPVNRCRHGVPKIMCPICILGGRTPMNEITPTIALRRLRRHPRRLLHRPPGRPHHPRRPSQARPRVPRLRRRRRPRPEPRERCRRTAHHRSTIRTGVTR